MEENLPQDPNNANIPHTNEQPIEDVLAQAQIQYADIVKYKDESASKLSEINTIVQTVNTAVEANNEKLTKLFTEWTKKQEVIIVSYNSIQEEQDKIKKSLDENQKLVSLASVFLNRDYEALKSTILDPDSGIQSHYTKSEKALSEIEAIKIEIDKKRETFIASFEEFNKKAEDILAQISAKEQALKV